MPTADQPNDPSKCLAAGFARRPVVVVEDELHDCDVLLRNTLQDNPHAARCMTLLCLASADGDTPTWVARWLTAHDELQIAARVGIERIAAELRGRYRQVSKQETTDECFYGRLLSSLLQPKGLLLMDLILKTVHFPREREYPHDTNDNDKTRFWMDVAITAWKECNASLGGVGLRVMSHGAGRGAVFERPRNYGGEFYDKDYLADRIPDEIKSHVAKYRYVLVGQLPRAGIGIAVADAPNDLAGVLDLLLWPGHGLLGRAVKGTVSLKAGSQRSRFLNDLVETRLKRERGVPTGKMYYVRGKSGNDGRTAAEVRGEIRSQLDFELEAESGWYALPTDRSIALVLDADVLKATLDQFSPR